MKRYFVTAAALLLVLSGAAGCGNKQTTDSAPVKVSVESINNKTVDELKLLYQGTWEVSVVFVDNHDGIQFDFDRYKFKEDGTGLFIPQNSKHEDIKWAVTPEGDLEITYTERDGKVSDFEYVGGNLVNFEKEDRGVVETHLAKCEDINSEPNKIIKP